MKKLFSVLCAVALLLSTLAFPASAEEERDYLLERWEDSERSVRIPVNDGYVYFGDMGDHMVLYESKDLSGNAIIPETVEGKPVTKIIHRVATTSDVSSYYGLSGNKATSLTLPATLREIRGEGVFTSDTLKKVVFLGDGPEEIPYMAFESETFGNCPNLEEITLPKKVKVIEEGGLPLSLKKLELDPGNPYFTMDEQGLLYNKDKTKLVSAAQGAEERTEVIIPSSVRELEANVFAGNHKLQKITGGEKVTDALLRHWKYDEDIPYKTRECYPDLNPFQDTYGHWSEEYAKWTFQNDLFAGTKTFFFEPDKKITRGMFATVLWRLEGKPTPWGTAPLPYWDFPRSMYYTGPIRWLSDKGIVYGTSATTFSPEMNITREQMACMLYRYAVYKGEAYDTTLRGDLTIFTDYNRVSGYAEEAMSWAVGAGIISGMGNGTLNPRGPATRAETATVMQKLGEIQRDVPEEK